MPRLSLPRLARRASCIVAGCLMLAILALHAALLPEAHWQGDDYICSAFARDDGLAYLWQARIGGWSPRPLSEVAFYLYGRLAAALQRPLTVPFLAELWTLLFASTLASMRARRARTGGPRVLVGLAACCLFLLGHPVGEMFYWPAGAVAYVSTLACSSMAVFLLVDDRSRSWAGTVGLSCCLAACAACSEAGACLAVLLAPALAAVRWRSPARAWCIALPALGVAGFVFLEVSRHRLVSAEAVGHLTLLRSLGSAPGALWREAFAAWPASLAFLLGVRWCAARARPDTASLLTCAVALPLAGAAVIAAAWHQFGALCCERHESLRQCWLVLALLAAGVASVRCLPVSRRGAGFGPAALMLACLLGAAPRLPGILHDMRLMHAITATRRLDWSRGRGAADTMRFRLPPVARIAGGVDLPVGRFAEPADGAWQAHGVMQFFHKHRIVILPPAAAAAVVPSPG